jgi:hypothetical protein
VTYTSKTSEHKNNQAYWEKIQLGDLFQLPT